VQKTLVVIPAYDEEASLPGVLKELREQAPDFDVLVVSDGSTDRTAAVARADGARVLELPCNLGIGAALRVAFRYAVNHGYERVAQVDADGQHDPVTLERLLARIDDGADLVIGSRFAEGGAVTYDVSAFRRRGMKVLRHLVKRLTGREFTDTTSGFRAMSQPMVEHFSRSYPSEYMESVEALVDACRAGFNVIEIPVNMRGREGGAPSTRGFRLLYSYVRLVVVLVASAGGRPPVTR